MSQEIGTGDRESRDRNTAASPAMGGSPVIVSGLPRSGTSMMMRLLEAGGLGALTDNIRQADEDNPKGYYEFEAVKSIRDDASWLNGANGKVVKMVYRLLYDLPADREYHVIFMRRPLSEIIASQNTMLERQGMATNDLPAERLEAIYRHELDAADIWLKGRDNFRVLTVNYHDVLDEPERIANEINDFLGGSLDVAAMLKVPDRSLYRQRR